MRSAGAAFMTLPAKTRLMFENDPEQFVSFAMDPKNADTMREWGLLKPKEAVPGPMKVEVVNPPAPPASGSEGS